jgi:hypothetical protein
VSVWKLLCRRIEAKSYVEIPSNNGAFIDLGRKKEEEREKELG